MVVAAQAAPAAVLVAVEAVAVALAVAVVAPEAAVAVRAVARAAAQAPEVPTSNMTKPSLRRGLFSRIAPA